MNKSVLISIKPYYVFLIIAKTMGWDFPKEKTLELRKNYPKDVDWNGRVIIYCSKNRNSFKRIPNKYKHFMAELIGKVIGEFDGHQRVSIPVDSNGNFVGYSFIGQKSCLWENEITKYIGFGKIGYGWYILNLNIYDKPKELKELHKKIGEVYCNDDAGCEHCEYWKSVRVNADEFDMDCSIGRYIGALVKPVEKPPQSWCYVEEG